MTLPHPFAQRPWLDIAVPQPAASVPTMLTEEESQLLYWLTRHHADGFGAICDLGCFAGGSTARLAAGVADAGRATPVHAYDNFTVEEKQKERFLYPAGIAPFEGRDMRHAAEQLLAPWPMVRLRPGNIFRTRWQDGPIEILFIDAAKTPHGTDRIAATFFPHLLAGRSIIVQQDYLHWRQPWVPAQMELLSDCVQPVAWCRRGTVAFQVTRTFTPDRLQAGRVEDLDDAAMLGLLRHAMSRFTERPQQIMLARAILGIQDNPGVRAPFRFDGSAIDQPRIREVLRAAGQTG